MCIRICYKINSTKSARYVHLMKIDGAQSCLRVCMCIEFVIQVLKQKNAHVYFQVGWYIKVEGIVGCCFAHTFWRSSSSCDFVLHDLLKTD